MENNENFVTEVTENVEQPTEQIAEKLFTQEDMNQAVSKGKARERAKIRKEYERKYGNLEEVLRAGTGKENVEEITDTFKEFYERKGIKLPEKPIYSDRDIEVLASAEAADVIGAGYEDVVEEVDRLTELGFDNMSPREKAYFKVLAEHRQKAERQSELAKIGVTEDEYNSKEFQEFAGMFKSNIPIAEIYKQYNKTKPKKEIKPMGSMTNKTPDDGVKDFYTQEDIERLSMDDLKNPKVWEAVRRSMTGE